MASADHRLQVLLFSKQRLLHCQSLILLAFFVLAHQAHGQSLDEKLDRSFPFASSNLEISRLLDEFSRRNALPLQVSEGLSGSVSIRNKDGTGRSFLDQLSARVNATWWHNDVIVFIEPVASIKSKNFDLGEVPFDILTKELKTMGLSKDQYPVSATQIGSLVRVSGPTEYLSNVEDFIDDLKTAHVEELSPVAVKATQPKIYFGQSPALAAEAIQETE